ncbi:Lrp/AsnC family transcriptional regulator [Spirillospora sp. CA-108201]
MDQTDWSILAELQRDGRLSFNRLAALVNLSPPAVAERVRRLEESGVITGYQARVDPARVGQPLTAFVQMRCALGRCLLKTSAAEDLPEVTEVHKLSGSRCSMLRGAGRLDAAPGGTPGTPRGARRDELAHRPVDRLRGPRGGAARPRDPQGHALGGLDPLSRRTRPPRGFAFLRTARRCRR